MARVYQGQPCGLDRGLGLARAAHLPIARLVDPHREMSWSQYAVAVLLFNALGFVVVYALLRLQDVLPLNPQHFAANSPDLAFNTAASFATNTNWQSYGGESTMSYLSQMLGADGAELRLGGVRHGRARRADPRPGAPHERARSATSGSTWSAARSTSCCRCRSCWRWSWFRRASSRTFKPYETATLVQAGDRRRRQARRRADACRWARPRRKSRSSSSAPTAADSSTSTRPIRSRTRRRSPTSSKMLAILLIAAGAVLHVRRDGRRHAARLGACWPRCS